MKNVMENQLSWFTLLMTAFYSLLASCRGEDCGHEELHRCARPLQQIADTPADYVKSKAALEELCPELEAGMQCINRYTMRCMTDRQRQHFIELYSGTNKAVMELCQDGLYQDKFLLYSPCMQKVKTEFDSCSQNYAAAMQVIATEKQPDKVKSICCSFQQYINCSHNTVLKTCGNEAAKFTKEFLDRMSGSLIKMHCQSYSSDKCTISHTPASVRDPANRKNAGSSGAVKSSTTTGGGLIVTFVIFTASKYYLF